MRQSEREDFLMRQVREFAAALARIAGLRGGGQAEAARVELERSYGLLLGSGSDVVRRVDAGTAAALLNAPERILIFARLILEESEQAGAARAPGLRERAVTLGREAARRDPRNESIRQFLDELGPGPPSPAETGSAPPSIAEPGPAASG